MTAIKPILIEFLAWLETTYGDAERGADSEFALEPAPGTLAVAEVALEASLNGERPVVFASATPEKTIIAALLLWRAGIKLDHVFQGRFTDDQFDALAETLRTVKACKLLIDAS